MLTENELNVYLNNVVSPTNFKIFAALSNLENVDNFKRIIDLLYFCNINLFDLANLDTIDDVAIEKFLNNYYRFRLPYINDTTVSIQNVYDQMLSTDSVLSTFLSVYNNAATHEYTVVNKPKISPSLYTKFDIETLYTSVGDFENDFNSKVTTPLLEKYNITNISSLVPTISIPSSIHTSIAPLFQRLIDLTLKPFKDKFNNATLSEVYVWLPTRPSIAVEYSNILHGMLNLKEYSSLVKDNLLVDLTRISARSSNTFTRAELDAEWNELVNTDLTNTDLTDLIAYIRYKVAFINTLEQKHNGLIRIGLEEWLIDFIHTIHLYTELHENIGNMISSRMYVQTL